MGAKKGDCGCGCIGQKPADQKNSKTRKKPKKSK